MRTDSRAYSVVLPRAVSRPLRKDSRQAFRYTRDILIPHERAITHRLSESKMQVKMCCSDGYIKHKTLHREM